MLGTSSMVPTRTRSAPAVLVEYAGEYILIDCGEGTQRQMNIAGKSRVRVRKILLTHWHGDHVGGLGPLLQTMFNTEGAHDVDLFGPAGTAERFRCLSCAMDLATDRVHVHEIEASDAVTTFWEGPAYVLECVAMRHGLSTLGYALVERARRHVDMARAAALGLAAGPAIGRLQRNETVVMDGRTIVPDEVTYVAAGKKIALVTDTLETENIIRLADEADLLICEATYNAQHAELATAYQHMTALQAATLAREARVKRLVLTHFSQRYEDVTPLLDEARSVLPNTIVADDFLSLEV
jgi:ribonuclease Z